MGGGEVLVGGLAARREGDGAEAFERLALQLPDGVAVDEGLTGEDPAAQFGGAAQQPVEVRADVGAERGVLGDRLDAQVHRVGEAAGGRPVRGGVGGRAGDGRVQGVDLDESGAVHASGPGGEFGEVAEVAHAPGAVREQRVELDEQAPGAGLGPADVVRGDDEVAGGGASVGRGGLDPVDAERYGPQHVGGGRRALPAGGGGAVAAGTRGTVQFQAGGGASPTGAARRTASPASRPPAGAGRAGTGSGSRVRRTRVPGGSAASSGAVRGSADGAADRSTTVGGSRRAACPASAFSRAARIASGLLASTPRAARAATTADSAAGTVRSGEGE